MTIECQCKICQLSRQAVIIISKLRSEGMDEEADFVGVIMDEMCYLELDRDAYSNALQNKYAQWFLYEAIP